MLASLLPGLRDVRTPLTVGYLWLFIGWAWFGDRFPRTRPPGHGLVARLFDLHTVVGTPATTAAVSFLAYLLGALLTVPVESRAVSTVLHRVGRLSPGAREAAASYDAYLATAYNQVESRPTAVAFDEFASNFDVSESDLWARLLVANDLPGRWRPSLKPGCRRGRVVGADGAAAVVERVLAVRVPAGAR